MIGGHFARKATFGRGFMHQQSGEEVVESPGSAAKMRETDHPATRLLRAPSYSLRKPIA